ncbi:MAG: hypothetical protein JWM03_1280, partial [Rhodocyclales bacterium]|nr:hypothetical protein [Rhodocyclales bacterium]
MSLNPPAVNPSLRTAIDEQLLNTVGVSAQNTTQ